MALLSTPEDIIIIIFGGLYAESFTLTRCESEAANHCLLIGHESKQTQTQSFKEAAHSIAKAPRALDAVRANTKGVLCKGGASVDNKQYRVVRATGARVERSVNRRRSIRFYCASVGGDRQ
ncbi:hypothetical protein EVAR_14174_1 [Eumeta japonica]|uniref:Uncharacterized protein n=1 Tax=Eumeta variegata TaxID=151549 RepID=A0A4C1UEG2_EUMVA|nr:hypothetical protein EVAR_14174_1 [Eumeta japonica]